MHLQEDIKLFQSIKEGDKKAFDEIYKIYQQDVYWTAHRILRNAEDAEDITQVVFMTLWNKKAKIEVTTTLRHYLTRMASNNAINKLKHDSNYLLRNQRYTAMNTATEQPYINNNYNEQLDDVTQKMKELPEKSRRTLKMVYEEGLPHKEIAKIEGISVNTVKTQLYSSLRLLRSKLQLK